MARPSRPGLAGILILFGGHRVRDSRNSHRRLLKPRPFHGDSTLVNLGQFLKHGSRHVDVCHSTPDASIHDRHIHALVVPAQSQFHSAERVVVGV